MTTTYIVKATQTIRTARDPLAALTAQVFGQEYTDYVEEEMHFAEKAYSSARSANTFAAKLQGQGCRVRIDRVTT